MANQVERSLFSDDGATGVRISLKPPGRDRAGLEDFSGMCHGANGCAAMTPTRSNLDQAGTEFDMDAATGYKRRPGSAGAHPTMRRPGSAPEYLFMSGQAGSLVPKEAYPAETD